MIVSLRGGHGSGKTTVVYKLLATPRKVPIYGMFGPKKPEAYCLPGKCPLYVLGPYVGTAIGGADLITSHSGLDTLIELIEKYRAKGDVLYEGILVSFLFGSVGEYLVKRQKEVIIAVMDTSFETCLAGLRARSALTGRGGGTKHTAALYKRVIGMKQRMTELGFRVETVSRDNAVSKILEWLK